MWQAYDDAQQQLAQRYEEALGGTPADGDALQPLTEEQQHIDLILDLEERLEQQRQQDWATYGSDLKAAVEAAARRRTGLRVPTIVTVHLDAFRPAEDQHTGSGWDITDQLRTEAIASTRLPGGGRPPLQRLLGSTLLE